jgi:predicted ATPase
MGQVRPDGFAAYSVDVEKLLERERELAAVDDLVQRGSVAAWQRGSVAAWQRGSVAAWQRGGVVLVEGRAGIGKTALLEAACQRAAARGREVLRARGSELEAGFAFGVVRQLFERRLVSADETERAGWLAGSAGAVRSLLLGELVEPSAFDTSLRCCTGSTG